MTYHPQVHKISDPVFSLAQDIVGAYDLDDLRFETMPGARGMPRVPSDQRHIARVSRKREEIIERVQSTLICGRLEASAAVVKAIDRAIDREGQKHAEALP